jgi:PAS domain S-box-containing protein
MPSTLRRISGIAFAVVAVVLMVVSAVGFRSVRRSVEANESVAHTYQVLNALENVLTTLVDAETGTRGYGVTGLSRYLEPFDRAKTQVAPSVEAVAALTADNPTQQHHVAELRTQTGVTMQVMQQIVSLGQSNQPIPLELHDREKASMDAARTTLQQMRLEEQRLMEQRSENASQAATAAQALIVGLIAVAFGVLAVSFLFVDRRAVQLRHLNESLSERVRDRTAELEHAFASERVARQIAEHAQRRFRRVVEGAPTAMVAVDKRGTVVLVNSLTERLFGYAPGELIGKPVEMLVPERFRQNHQQYRTGFSDAPEMRQMGVGRDLYAVRRDGSEVPVEIGLNPIDVDGEVLVLGSIVDITDRKHAEDDRAQLFEGEKRARAEADAANRAKDLFLARVSHELRTPLNALMGWTRMLRDGSVAGAKVANAIASIDRNAEVLNKLVEDLVEMSRLTTGRLQLDRKPLDIIAVIRESVNLLEPAMNAKRVGLETRIDTEPITVDGDAVRLRQVFWNLMSNAIKFTPSDGRVAVSAGLSDGEVEISVTDTGQGIAPEFIPHVFDPFTQEDSTGPGLGLGLAIVQQLVKAHDGRISVTSAGSGAGATFTVHLPVARVPERV